MDYNPQEIEAKWQAYWEEHKIYQTETNSDKPKFYALDMFPYPSGAGLHVGHPLGYIASDIISRFKRMQGYNVLHPMGFDSFGLPAEQYAIETGQHPAITTKQNIETFKAQLGKLGFDYDWSREVQTSSPDFYKWTQWIFQQIFDSWYNQKTDKAEPISELISEFEKNGNTQVKADCDEDTPSFSAEEWNKFSAEEKQHLLLKYRLTYVADSIVNWCPVLGTVLANDEIKDGFSERGGHPVERKKMRQWMMRITAYSEKLLQGLDGIEWSDAVKEMQRNWIGKSFGAEMEFEIDPSGVSGVLKVFTTRPDTIYGVTFMVIAPELDLVDTLTTPEQKEEVAKYVNWAKNRSERERQSEVKTVTGVFTGSYAINSFSGEKIPIWIADYVLAGYGTGVVMAVPSSDDRDFRFATQFGISIKCVIEGSEDLDDPTEIKHGKLINSGSLNGMNTQDAIQEVIKEIEKRGIGKGKINYRLRDAVFSRQRYWGEPVPVYFEGDIPKVLPEMTLPLHLPEIDEYKPTEEGEPPLGRAENWKYEDKYEYELTTMPGWAGSSWYFLRYMDAQNNEEFASKKATEYWNQVDLYIGGTEHAVGHLLYSRFWTQFLCDRGFINHREPFKKLINQGMIQGMSALVYRVKDEDKFVSFDLKNDYETTELHVDVSLVEGDVLDIEAFKSWRPETANYEFITGKDGKFICGNRVEKMSKRWYNVVNPDAVVARYSADTMRLYEMFLGPLEQSKPWDPKNIDGSFRFLRKLWRLFENEQSEFYVSGDAPSKDEWKVLHRTIKKVKEDLDRYSFNTVVSEFMKLVNDLNALKCNKQAIFEPMLRMMAPYIPHITEELWAKMGHIKSIHIEQFPDFDEKYLKEDAFTYPIMINGKKRHLMDFAAEMNQADITTEVLADETVQKWLEGKAPKKIIIVPKKIVNIVV
jgi:leucyl-tRNA synthetase